MAWYVEDVLWSTKTKVNPILAGSIKSHEVVYQVPRAIREWLAEHYTLKSPKHKLLFCFGFFLM